MTEQQPKIDEHGNITMPDLDLVPVGDQLEKYRKDVINSPDKLTQVHGFAALGQAYNVSLCQKEQMLNQLIFRFGGTSEELDILSLRVDEVTDEALQTMSDEQIQEFYNINGKQITLNFDSTTPLPVRPKLYRDYLRQVRVSYDAVAMIDKQIDGLKELMSEYDEEVSKNSKDLAQFNDYIYGLFTEKLDDPNITEDEKKVVNQFISLNSDGLTLVPLYDYFSEDIKLHGSKSFRYAYSNNFESIAAQASAAVSPYGMDLYYNTYTNFEQYLTGDNAEKYQKTPDLFAFILFRYIKYKAKNEKLTQLDVGFCSQVINNMVLVKGKNLDEGRRAKFEESVKRVLDIVLDK